MNYDEDKVDEYTLALLYLVVNQRHEGFGASAWKGFDWDTLNRLHEKGCISNPIGKTKSVVMTENGFLKAKELFEKYFAHEAKIISLPKFAAPARKRWNQIPEVIRKDIMDNVWCSRCSAVTAIELREGVMERRSLVLRGVCKRCGGEVARVIEPEE
jgi:hypothetical protein